MKTAHRKAARAKRQRYDLVNPITHAMARAGTLSAADLRESMAPIQAAVHALQFGGFTLVNWTNLADGFHIGETLAGMRIANDHIDKFDAAQKVLYALSERKRDAGTWAARGTEMQAVKDAAEIFEIQLTLASVGELLAAVKRVKNRIAQAQEGNGAAGLVVVDGEGLEA